MWRCRWTRSCPSIPAASCTPAGAGTVILMIYTWLRNTLSKTRNSMRWTVACLPARRDRPGRKRRGAGGVQAGLYRLARRYGNHLPPQGCICVRRYPVCRERCGQPVQRRGVRPCRRRQEALGKHQGMEARRSYREIRRPPERYHPCQRQDLCHPRRKPYRDFDAKSHQFLTCIGNGSWGTGPTQTVHAFDVLLYKGLVMIHDKRYVNFVEEQAIQSGVTPRIYVRSEHLGETNGTYGMAVDEQTGLLYSTHPAKRIDLFALTGYGKEFHPNAPGNWLIKMYLRLGFLRRKAVCKFQRHRKVL